MDGLPLLLITGTQIGPSVQQQFNHLKRKKQTNNQTFKKIDEDDYNAAL